MTRIYVVVNRINFKMYIGQTINTLARRFNGHITSTKKGSSTPFHKALRKYGRESFEVVELAKTDDREYAHFLERMYIFFYHSHGALGYNASAGGEAPAYGMRHTKRWCREHSKRMSGEGHPLFGTKMSKETKKRMSVTKKSKGKLVRSDIPNELVTNLYASGMGTRAMERTLHMTRQSIRKRLKSLGVKSHPAGRQAYK